MMPSVGLSSFSYRHNASGASDAQTVLCKRHPSPLDPRPQDHLHRDRLQIPFLISVCVSVFPHTCNGEAPAANCSLTRFAEVFASTILHIHTIVPRMNPTITTMRTHEIPISTKNKIPLPTCPL